MPDAGYYNMEAIRSSGRRSVLGIASAWVRSNSRAHPGLWIICLWFQPWLLGSWI